MNATEIFQANQVLTFAIAKTLIGKRVCTTNPEYRDNTPQVSKFTIKGFVTEWDKAYQEECSGYNNRQEYWKSYMNENKINELKNTLLMQTEYDNEYWNKVAVRCYTESSFFNEPTFHGSDADREVYYIEL